ncbi:MAG: methyltransferase domain-containing protein [Methyloceanibacter sp.]|jgi:malonyl-CoA O-methyltransferase|nr:methyltransferase domain-containing protein [Methyloceanibacter sp.]
MSLNSPILSRHSAEIAASFGARAESYERHAGLQRAVAGKLARFLPALENPHVLELGCGTGLFSRHLIERYKQGHFVLTDAAPAMIAECRRNLTPFGAAHISFEVMDAGQAGGHAGLDLIVSSMTLHWLADPVASLERLRRFLAPDGLLLYAALGPQSFAEWRAVLASEGLPSGLADIPPLPGVVDEERLSPDADTLSFLRRMQAVGGITPREGYTPLPPGALRRAIRATDARFGGRITWHIVYGALGAPEASASRPSAMPA